MLECARAAKINIPDEMALVGVDDDILCEHTHPSLASIRPDSEQEGYYAAEVLDRMFWKRKWTKSTLCKISGISERESASAIENGASGAISKTASKEELFQCIRNVIGGTTAIAPDVAQSLDETDDIPKLTDR